MNLIFLFENIVIPYREVKKRGSLPAMHMHDWLMISVDLRERAVQARQKHRELLSSAAEGDSEDEAGEDDETEAGDGSTVASHSRASSVEHLEKDDKSEN
jgi:hypothetical protein